MIRRKEEDCGLWKWQAQRLNICICILQNAGARFCSCMKKGSMNILFNWEAGGIMNRWKGLWKWRGQRLNILHNSERNTRHHLNLSSITKIQSSTTLSLKTWTLSSIIIKIVFNISLTILTSLDSRKICMLFIKQVFTHDNSAGISALFMNVSKLLLWSGQFLKQLNLLYGQTLGNGVSKSALILVPTSFQQRV